VGPVTAQQMIVVALIPLIAWRLYRRVRGMIGRQTSRMRRHWTAVVFFPVVALLIALVTLAYPPALAGLGAGIAAGVGLAIWGLKLTRFEHTAEGYFYTPNAHIGVALSVLFAARIVWRIFEMESFAGAGGMPAHFAASPLTLAIFGALVAYYTTYAAGLLRWRLRLRDAPPPTPGPG
jgi:hypothetical protein